jgi:hypothetical protein
MLTMESGEWPIQCPVRTEDSSTVVLAFRVIGMGIEEFSNTGQTVSGSRAKLSIVQSK